MLKLFARNQPKTELPDVHAMESVRVLRAVHQDIGATEGGYVAWMPITSVFMELALSDKYKDISIELSRIESRTCFD